MTSFYGFDWQKSPAFSRLFSQPVFDQAQTAYNQGMGAFKQFDPAQLEQARAAMQQRLAAQNAPSPQASATKGLMIGPDGRIYDTSNMNFLRSFGTNNPNVRDGLSAPQHVNFVTKKYGVDYLKNIGWKPLGGA